MPDISKYIDANTYQYLSPEEQTEIDILFDSKRWAEDRLGWIARDYQEEFFDCLLDSKQIVLRFGRRLGKCLPGWSRVFDPITGERVAIEELLKRGTANVVTMTDSHKLINSSTKHIFDNGVKEVFRVTLTSGRELDATGNHPLYTMSGYIDIDNLKVGDHIAIPRSLDYFGDNPLDDYRIKYLAYMTSYGVMSEAGNKFVPDIIFTLSKEGIVLFLSELLLTDGFITTVDKGSKIEELRYYSTSKRLVIDIQHLLLRCGIMSSISKVEEYHDSGTRVYYQLTTCYEEETQNSDIYWDSIKSIESIGYHNTYDLTVPGTHNFVVEDTITHNTDEMIVAALYYGETQINIDPKKFSYRIIVICPYDSQVDEFFSRLKVIVENSNKMSDSITLTHHKATFANGTIILGKTAGSKANKGAVSLRGQGPDLILLDECDYLSDKDITTIMQYKNEAPDRIRVIAASTPTGDRRMFYRWCTEAEKLGWKHIHRSSLISKEIHQVNPDNSYGLTYLEEMKQQLTELEFLHELEAEFGDNQKALFQKRFLDIALKMGRDMDYKYDDLSFEPPIKKGPRILSVDWDKAAACTNILVMEFNKIDSLFYIVNRTEIPSHEFTYTEAMHRIIAYNKRYDLDWLYIDRGYGETQIELLKVEGMRDRSSGLVNKIVGIQFSQKIEVRDPHTKVKIKKDIKPYMVNNAVNVFEKGLIVLQDKDYKVVKQLQDYSIAKTSASGRPIYTDQEEHIVDCICLALFGFEQKYGTLFNIVMQARVVGLRSMAFEDEKVRVEDASKKPRVVNLTSVAVSSIRNKYSGTNVGSRGVMRTGSRRAF